MDDKQIVELYWDRSEDAIAQTEKKYGWYCRYIAQRILGNEEDAEEVVNDTYLKTWNSIPPHRPDELKPYVAMICRRTALDRHEKNSADKRGYGQTALILDELAECIPSNADNFGETLALHEALNKFIRSLPEKTRRIFVRRYWYASTVTELCHAFSMKESNVKMLLLRTRKKLKEFLEKDGFEA
ncbi:MAG: sigma-70 family RNA polymerase sigma factor [Clostridia bacterium]|nr:sigma-70 family RNA polymerase sigma factor [Clostridia bacterium]